MKPFVFNQPLTRLRLLFVCALICTKFSFAQNTIVTPLDNQLFPIDHSVTPMVATVKFTGTITTHTLVRIYVQQDNSGPFTLAQVTTITGNVLNTTVQLGAIGGSFLHTFNYEIRGVAGAVETLIKAVNNIVGGDVYIINGQSNALSVVWNGDANTPATSVRQWVRTYGSATTTHFGYTKHWGNADGNSMNEATDLGIGQWGMRMASQLVRSTNIPVAIFNGAKFGNVIAYFGKGFNEGLGETNNYTRLLDRIAETKTTIIRGLLWDQGEDDAFAGLTTAQYKAAFNQLYNDWTVDYNPGRFYIFQIRYGCYYNSGISAQAFLQIMEAQREQGTDHSNITLISTNAADQFDQGPTANFCHYPYTGGYERFGDWATDLVLRDSYGINNGVLIDPPNPVSASFTATSSPGVPNQLSVFMFDATASDIAANIGAQTLASLFALKKTGSAASFPISSVTVASSGAARVIINFSGANSSTIPDSISYLPHFGLGTGQGATNIRNIISGGHGGLGLLNFKMLISAGILPLDPLELSASKKDKGNALHWNVETNGDFRVFIVERSEDGQNFAEIASVNPSPAELKCSYDYLDQSPTAKALYRVKGLKKAGNYIYSQVVAISSNSGSGKGLQIYPNPVTDRATISLSMNEPTNADIQLFSVSGKLMSSRKITLQKGSNYVGVSEATILNPGIYLLRVVTPDEVYTGRLIKSK